MCLDEERIRWDPSSGRARSLHKPSIAGVERCASNAVAPDIHHNRESMNACPSHSHRSAIGPDNPRLGAKCAIDPAATDQSKLGGRDSWTAKWQKRTRREAFDCDDWFGGGIRRGPQSGCGQGSRIAGKQERSSSQVALQLIPDLEVGGACAQQGGAGRHRSGLECCVTTPTRGRRGVQRHERTAGTIRCFAMGKSCFRGVSHASGHIECPVFRGPKESPAEAGL
jgi:hypothetical protein